MFENTSEQFHISEIQKEALRLVTREIIDRGLVVKYSRGLRNLAEQRDKLLSPSAQDSNDPHARLFRALFGPTPSKTMAETFFGIRVDEPLEGDTDIATHYSIVHVDPVTGVILEGCDVLVGSILDENYTVNPSMTDIFTIQDLSLVRGMAKSQMTVGFNPRLG